MKQVNTHHMIRNLCVRLLRLSVALILTTMLVACDPSDSRPGLWLSGDDAAALPADWTFTDQHNEIYLEVQTPYFIPHSVTIWCAQVGGQLYIGARNPETKNWPAWVEKKPDVRLKIGDTVYAVNAVDAAEEAVLAPLRIAYANKYKLDPPADGKAPPMRYWAIQAR